MMNILELIKTALRFGQTPPVYPSRCLLQLGVCSLQRFPRTLDFFLHVSWHEFLLCSATSSYVDFPSPDLAGSDICHRREVNRFSPCTRRTRPCHKLRNIEKPTARNPRSESESWGKDGSEEPSWIRDPWSNWKKRSCGRHLLQSFQNMCFDLDAVLPRPNSISKSVLWEQDPRHAEFFTKVRPPCQGRSVFFWLHQNPGLCMMIMIV